MPGERVLVFDLDGTLVQNGARVDWENWETFDSHCRPYLDAWRRVRQVKAQGHGIVFLSARGPHLRGVTHDQVRRFGGQDVFQGADILIREAWDSFVHDGRIDWTAYVTWKADILADLKADLYVGDRDEDQTAAAMAGVCFMRAEAWRACVPWEPILEAEPHSDLRLAAAHSTERARDLGVLPALQAVTRDWLVQQRGVAWEPEGA